MVPAGDDAPVWCDGRSGARAWSSIACRGGRDPGWPRHRFLPTSDLTCRLQGWRAGRRCDRAVAERRSPAEARCSAILERATVWVFTPSMLLGGKCVQARGALGVGMPRGRDDADNGGLDIRAVARTLAERRHHPAASSKRAIGRGELSPGGFGPIEAVRFQSLTPIEVRHSACRLSALSESAKYLPLSANSRRADMMTCSFARENLAR